MKRIAGIAGMLLVVLVLSSVVWLRTEHGAERKAAKTVSATPDSSLLINGAGATFPNPIYSKWFKSYTTAHPNEREYANLARGVAYRVVYARAAVEVPTAGLHTLNIWMGKDGVNPPM